MNLSPTYLIDFTRRLYEHGYALLSIESYIDSISHFGTWLNKQEIFIKDVSPKVLCNFSAHRYCCPGSRREHTHSKRYASRIHNFIIYLHQKGIVNCRFDGPTNTLPLSKFSESLHLRGLSINTINRYTHSANMILPLLGNEPKDYDAKLIKQTVYTLSQRYDLAGLKSLITSFRSYLRFLAVEEQCIPGLDKAVPTVANWSLSSIPKYITANEVEQVINSCDVLTSKGLRDRAIILLLSRIGLRAGDIVHMKLDHIDWQKSILHLFGKGRREACLPLPQAAGDAILDYMEKARPPIEYR
ncbi:MAG: integrase/recombinase XerD [Arenicella sp.]|jgi:integrase/recombinase XerD